MATTRKRSSALAALLAAGTLAFGLAGSTATAAVAAPSAAVRTTAATTAAPFGPGCAKVLGTGSGSFSGMAMAQVATAASKNPQLSALVAAAQKAGLVNTLNSAKNITVFVPDNAAFAKIPKAMLNSVLADKAELIKILTYHVVPGQLSPSALAGTHKTLEGSTLTVTGSGQNFKVNGTATVQCGDIHAANATIYVIDTVLMPQS
jgi:uncharacterized surface protein with fasciclin (FAS1) repeats